MSLATYPLVQDRYVLLPHGASIGSGYGPIVVAREPLSLDELRDDRDRRSRAADDRVPRAADVRSAATFAYRVLPFDEILAEVRAGRARRGPADPRGAADVRATQGSRSALDLGEWWLLETGPAAAARRQHRAPRPRRRGAARASRRSCASRSTRRSSTARRRSSTRSASAAAWTPSARDRFVGMYVNELTLRLRRRGPRGGRASCCRAEALGVYDVRAVELRVAVSRAPSSSPAVRTPIGRYGGALVGRAARTISRRSSIAAAVERAGVAGERDRGRLLRLREPGGRGQPQRRAHGRAARGPAASRSPASRSTGSARRGSPRSSARATRCVAGDGDLFVAGGVESMSRAPLVDGEAGQGVPARQPGRCTTRTLGWRFPNPQLEAMFPLESMGETGENVAERWGVSREDQDAFALESQRRWAAAARGRALRRRARAGRRRRRATSIRAPTRAPRSSPR